MLVANTYEEQLGQLKFGQPYEFKYTLTNPEKEKKIYIKNVVMGCNSCTKVNYNRKELEPGESMDLNVTFTPGSTGINLKVITVFYELEGVINPQLVLKFRATIN